MSNMMASLPPLRGKPCPRRWLIRAEEGRGHGQSKQWVWRGKGWGVIGEEGLG